MTDTEPDEVVDFWFSERLRPLWFARDEALDREIAERFGPAVEAARAGALDAWRGSARGALALVILLDQFPRNLHRGSARAFASDARAREVAGAAIDAGLDRGLSTEERQFLYMPFMHAEVIDAQQRSMRLFTELGDENTLDYARRHHDVIARFGRFPHRNAVLGRETTADEAAFLEEHGGF